MVDSWQLRHLSPPVVALECPVAPIKVDAKDASELWQAEQSNVPMGTWVPTLVISAGWYVTGGGEAQDACSVVQPANGARLAVPAVQAVWQATQLVLLTAATVVSLVTESVTPVCKLASVPSVVVP